MKIDFATGRHLPQKDILQRSAKGLARRFCSVSFLGLLLFLVSTIAAAPSAEYDVVIRNGHIIDGTGSPWYAGDIGIRDGHIATIGHLSEALAKQQIDAAGRVVAPGFIDMNGWSDFSILIDQHVPSKIYQGITSEITGEGDSVAPVDDATLASRKAWLESIGVKLDWRTFTEYFARLQKQGMAVNHGTYVGATRIRQFVIGDADRAPTLQELQRMKGIVAEAMRRGALGVGSSLMYSPAIYASTEE